MTQRESKTFAANLATFVRLRMAHVERSALAVRCTGDGSMIGPDACIEWIRARNQTEVRR